MVAGRRRGQQAPRLPGFHKTGTMAVMTSRPPFRRCGTGRRPGPRSALPTWVAALLLALLAGCGAVDARPDAAESSSRAGGSFGARTSRSADAPAGTPMSAPSVSARPTPPAPTGTFPDAAVVKAGTACQPSQLELVAGGTDHALMYREFTVTATNTGSTSCLLAGFASVQFRGTDGSTFWVAESHDLMPEPVPKDPSPVTVAPGATATVRIGWSGTGAVHGLEQAGEVIMTVTRGSAPAPVQLDPWTLPIDIVDGGTVRIGEWRPAESATG